MIRPFDWRDFGLIRRLSEHGVCFDSEAALTRGPHTLQSAVLSFLAPGAGLPTFIWRNNEHNGDSGFGQIRFRHGDELARLVFMAPAYSENGPWETLFECLTAEAASRGAHSLRRSGRAQPGVRGHAPLRVCHLHPATPLAGEQTARHNRAARRHPLALPAHQ